LAEELANEASLIPGRILAGVYLKNMLNAKDPQLQAEKHGKWKAQPATARNPVKEQLLLALRSQNAQIARSAAVAASEIAAVELPYNEWPTFLPTLLDYCSNAHHPAEVKVSSIECLGYTSERAADLADISDGPEIPDEAVNSMLTAIINGIQPDAGENVRAVAATALRNALVFCNKNMENKAERDAIMTAVCEATRSQNEKVRTSAFDCLCQIAYLYYNYLQDYMTTLFEISVQAIRNDVEDVAKNAIEFWNTICDVEQERLDEVAECNEQGIPVPPDRICVNYAAAALDNLVPLLLETLIKQEEDADEDTFNLHMAGTICLGLLSQTVEDRIVQHVMPFVTQYIQHQEWRRRDAAIMAFQCILDGPASATIGPSVQQSIPSLLSTISDQHPMVRDTTAHCISQICKYHVQSIPGEMFPPLLQALMGKCGDPSSKVASQACSAIHNLASAFQEESFGHQPTNALSAFMGPLLHTLWKVCDREDATESNLRVAAMEAIAMLVQVSAMDMKPMLVQLLPAVIERLSKALSMPALQQEDKENKEQLQGLLCALIQVLYQKLDKPEVAPFTDNVMTCLLHVLQQPNATSHDEVFPAISAIADLLEEDFWVGFEAFRFCVFVKYCFQFLTHDSSLSQP